jgi:tripartite-type tricarboxylate transporter receptor subunit TctC
MEFGRLKIGRRAALGGFLVAAAAGQSRAGEFPDHPMKWLVPFPPGGSNDTFSRPVAAFVGKSLGQPIIVENRGGAGGTMGGTIAARAKPDGYTLLVGNTGLAYAPVAYPDSNFDLVRDFEALSLIARVPVALVINPSVMDAKDLAGFLAAARKSPGSINIGSSGLGTIPHLAIELLQQRAGIQLNHVPYRGGGEGLRDLVAGQIQAIFVPLGVVVSYVLSGKLRGLAVAAAQREPAAATVPTFAEAGMPDFRVSSWYGLFAPKGTPAPVLDKLQGAIQAALGEEDIKRIWAEQGARIILESRQVFGEFVKTETERWGAIAKKVGIPTE